MKKKETIERIYITNEDFKKIENEIRFHEHLRRYASVRRFCYGKVMDFACGCGYGSYLLSCNPDVKEIYAVDIDKESIEWAKHEFKHEKITYINSSVETIDKKIDTLVSLETIEHLKDVSIIKNLVKKCNVDNLILCFPDKKSTHFNSFHYHDFTFQDIIDMFPAYLCYHSYKHGDVQFVLMMKLPENAPSHIFRNLKDLY
ncbi:MAG: class I SAM-dependent methyltransferase [Candidatus Wallbacteria bacterium]